MTGIMLVLVVLLWGMGCIVAYRDHQQEKHFFFHGRDTNQFDRFMWGMMGVLKVLFCLAVFGGILRLYFIVG